MKRKMTVLSIGAVFLVCASALLAEDRLVPSVYPTIQAGIDAAAPGDAVVIAAGTYTGAGNRDLDFGGSAITVRSADPNNPDVVAATIIDCQGSGRGFYFQSGETSSSVLAGLTITNGYDAVWGGGVYCYGSSPTIEKCTFSSNTASMGGGGVAIESCSPMVVNCVFSGNTGGWYGGGINNYDSSAIVKNCIFSGNGASAGGGLVNFESSATTTNCTFSGNYADQGGGIYNYDSSSASVSNCILWGDTAPDEPEIYGDCSVSYSDVQGGCFGEGNIDADPCFADAMSGDYHLLEGSPCIDAGDPAYSPAPGETDIDGEPRVMGVSVDIGVDESPTDRPVFEIWPGELEFFAGLGGPNPEAQVLSIRNRGGGVLNWEITEDCPWLNATPTSGESWGEVNEVTISVDVSGLAWGEYSCELTISDPCALNSPQTVDVNLTVIGPAIELSSQVFEFSAGLGGPNPGDQQLGIRNSGSGRLNWEISEDCGWLSAEPNSGSSTGEVNQVTLSVDVSGLTAGNYYCGLMVLDPNAENNPQMVDVDLTVIRPVIELSSQVFEFAAGVGGPNPAEQVLTIRNSGPGRLNWEITENCGWLSAEPNSGSSTGEVNQVNLSVDVSGLALGQYNCELTVSDPCAENSPQTIAVNLAIHPGFGFVSWWQFDECNGTTAYDSIGNNNGTVYGAARTGGQVGGALSFDGVDDYVDCGNDESLDIGGALTIVAWVYINTNGLYPSVVTKSAGIQDWGYCFQFSGMEINLFLENANETWTNDANTPVSLNQWTHIAATYDGVATIRYYFNGHPDGTHIVEGGKILSNSAKLLIGKRIDGYELNGTIDDVRIYDRALSDEEIWAVCEWGLSGAAYPCIEVSPQTFLFYAVEGGSNPEAQILTIRNGGGGQLNWTVTYDCNWVEVEPNSGSSYGEVNEVTLSVDVAGLSEGMYNCELTISDPNAENSPQIVDVDLIIHVPGVLHVPSEYPTIQAAIDDCNNGDVVIVEPNTYTGAGNKNLDFVGKAITVRSIDPEDPCVVAATVIDCENNGRGFYFHGGEGPNSIVSGLTVKRGKVTAKGGGVYCSGSSATIMNCIIASNRALGSYGGGDGGGAYGGGVYCTSNSHLILIDCTVGSNRTIGGQGGNRWCSYMSGCSGDLGNGGGGYGGGIYCSSDSNLTIEGCIISDNSASGGAGGIHYEDGEPTGGGNGGWARGGGVYCGSAASVKNCSFMDNTAAGGSGGDWSWGGTGGAGLGGAVYGQVTMSNCTIRHNEAFCGYGGEPVMTSGGGGACSIGSSSIRNCLIVENYIHQYYGSAVFRYEGSCLLANCTISDNTSDYSRVYAVVGASITNSIIWGHDGYDVSSGCTATYSCTEQNISGEGNIHDDPCFVSGPLGDYYLSQIAAGQESESPCVDAGSDTAANLGMDDCTTRIDGVGDEGTVDMGFHYGSCCLEPGQPADIDGDGDVDPVDYALFAADYYGNSMTIPRGTVVVDGNLGEWADPNMEWLSLDKVYWGSPNDVNEAWFALQWDPNTDKVYAAVIVHDSDHVFSDEYMYWNASDRLEVYSQGDAEGGSGSSGVYDVKQQYYVAPDTNDGSWATWGSGDNLGGDVGLEYTVTVNGEQIIYEIGVTQFDNYGGLSGGDTIFTSLSTGHIVGFDVVVLTCWGEDGSGMLSENLMLGKYLNADQFARYMLVEEPGGPPCFERASDLDGNCVIDFSDLNVLVDNYLWGK